MTRSAMSIAVLMALLSHDQQALGNITADSQISVQDIRVGLTSENTRLVFDLSGPVEYRLSTLENPSRVVLELPGGQSNILAESVALQGTHIRGFRADNLAQGSLSYLIAIDPGTDVRAFALQPHEDRGQRLVLDLHNSAGAPFTAESGAEHAASPEYAALDPRRASASPHRPPPTTASSSPAEPRDYAGEWSGYVSFDSRLFFQSPAFADQEDQDFSLAFKPEYYVDWANGSQQFGFSPFFRYDTADDQRTHADIRELYWRIEHDRWIAKAGVDIVFWGVTESQHLVDIINQTDLVENIDGEEKLGQPMLNLDYLSDWGNWQLYVLPYFRERTFPGKHGRLRTEPAVDTRRPEYESGSKEQHVDFALRWSHYFGDWDIGLAQFSGTSREPYLLPDDSSGKLRLIPLYLQIDQTSLDAQATKGAWLWKLEAIYNQNNLDNYYAYVGGFERTSFGVANTPIDLGMLLEYHYDERGDEATNGLQSDIYLGLRLTTNDIASTMALAGILYDTDTDSVFGNIEASRRLSEAWTLRLVSSVGLRAVVPCQFQQTRSAPRLARLRCPPPQRTSHRGSATPAPPAAGGCPPRRRLPFHWLLRPLRPWRVNSEQCKMQTCYEPCNTFSNRSQRG